MAGELETSRAKYEAEPPPATVQEYEYKISAGAVETLVNILLLNYGIDLRANYYDPMKDSIIFTSSKLIDLNSLWRAKIVRSYRITKVTKVCEVVEQKN